jgi:hypothetical protein
MSLKIITLVKKAFFFSALCFLKMNLQIEITKLLSYYDNFTDVQYISVNYYFFIIA